MRSFLRNTLVCAVLCVFASICGMVATVDANDGDLEYGRSPHVDPLLTLGVLAAEDYTEGIGDVVIPLYFSGEGLLFLNPRASFTDRSEEEFNVGLGYRHLIRDRMSVLGANMFYDHRETAAGVSFGQVGFGVEYLSHAFDLRANVYLPIDKQRKINEFSTVEESTMRSVNRTTSVQYDDPYATGNSILQPFEATTTTRIRTTTTSTTRHFHQYELAMRGWDAELGVHLPIEPIEQYVRLKAFAGYFVYYGRKGLDDVDGFRGRLEAHLRPAFTLDMTYYSDDELTGGNITVGAYVSVPFDLVALSNRRNPFAGAGERWDIGNQRHDMTYRLVDMVKRDPQIRSLITEPEEQTEQTTATSRSRTSSSSEETKGNAVVVDNMTFVSGDTGDDANPGTYEEPKLTIQEGVNAANSPVWVFDSASVYEENVTVPGGVQLYGNGTTLQGFGGKTWGGGAHPIVSGPAAGPTIQMLGNNVTVAGFDIRHSGAGAAGDVLDAVYGFDITHAGVYGGNVSGLLIRDNIMTDGSLRHGIVLASDGTMPGGSPNLAARILDNTIHNTGHDALLVRGQGGSGIFNLQVSGDYSFSTSGGGINIIGTGYDEGHIALFDVTAMSNDHSGIKNLQISTVGENGHAQISLDNVVASLNNGDGIETIRAEAVGDGSNAEIRLTNVRANHNNRNGFDNMEAEASGDNGHALIIMNDVIASHNDYDGFDDIEADAHGYGGNAEIHLTNVRANHNGSNGFNDMEAEARGDNGHALIIMNDVIASHNNSDGFDDIEADAHGDNGNAEIRLTNVRANHNNRNGFDDMEAYARGDGGHGLIIMNDVHASHNNYDGFDDIEADARGDGGHALIRLTNVRASYNNRNGFDDMEADARGDGGHGLIIMNDVHASYNNRDGFDDIEADARGDGGHALIRLTNVRASYNNRNGFDDMEAEARGEGGHARVIMNDVQANYNGYDGFDDIEADARGDGGHALIRLTNVRASYNQRHGFDDVETEAHGEGGHARVIMNDVFANQNKRSGFDGIRARTLDEDGDAEVRLTDVQANNNGRHGVNRIHAIAQESGDTLVVLQNVTANDNDNGSSILNQYSGFGEILSDASKGVARVSMTDVTALRNGSSSVGAGFETILARADGANNDAIITMTNITASDNEAEGISSISAESVLGNAEVTLSDIVARNNAARGIESIIAAASMIAGTAYIRFDDGDLTGNNPNGFNPPTASGSSWSIIISNVID